MGKKSKRRKANIPEGETKAERFVRVVTPRVVRAVKAINVIGYCAGSTYDSTPEQVKQMVETLVAAVEVMANKFSTKTSDTPSFEFKK